MKRVHNANDFLHEYRRCRDNYDRFFGPMVAAIRAKFAKGVDTTVDESLEAHLRTYVINDLLSALNWRMGISPESGLPNLVPESPLWSPGTKTQRLLDYLGVERDDCKRPLLIIETKRPSTALPRLMGHRRVKAAEAISLGLQGAKLSGEWSTWLNDLRDYVRAVHANTGAMPKKAVITNGTWIVVFTDPRDAFGASEAAATGKILVFENEASVDQDHPLLFEQLEYSRLSDVREPIHVGEVGFCVAPGTVAKVIRGVQLLYIETPGIYDPPSPYIKTVPLLFLGSTTGEWLCVRGPGDIEMPSRAHELPHHIAEVERVGAKMIADCAAILGDLPSPTKLTNHFATELDLLPGVREVQPNMYFVLTGDEPHYFRGQPTIPDCRWHDWQLARDDGFESHPQISERSTAPRAYFFSREPQHCAHRDVAQLKRSPLNALNRTDCGPRSGRDGHAFCEIWSFDTRLCCRTCTFEPVCTSARIFSLPCKSGYNPGGQSVVSSGGASGPSSGSPLVQVRPRGDVSRVRRTRLMADPANSDLLETMMRALVDEQRLFRSIELWGERNENEVRIAELCDASVFAPWHGAKFLQPQPEGLAYATRKDVDLIVEWTQTTLDCLVAADIELPNATWTTAELSVRCGLPEPRLAIGLLFLRFLITGYNPVDMDDAGRPTSVQLIRAVRTAPRQTLSARVEQEYVARNVSTASIAR